MHILFFLGFIILKFCLQLRQSLVLGEHDTFDEFQSKVADEDHGYDSENADFGPPEFDMPENAYMNEDVGSLNISWFYTGQSHCLNPVIKLSNSSICLYIYVYVAWQ